MKRSYGIISTPDDFHNSLPLALYNLALEGFCDPRLFIDGAVNVPDYLEPYDITFRYPSIGVLGNQILAVWELFLRFPKDDYYALFRIGDSPMIFDNNTIRVFLRQPFVTPMESKT